MLFEKVYPISTSILTIEKNESKIGNFLFNVIHKERVYPMSFQAREEMEKRTLKYKFIKFNNRFELQYLGVAICSVLLLAFVMNSAPYWLTSLMGTPFMGTVPCIASGYVRADKAGQKIIELGQYGIKWLSIGVVFYGMFLQLLKKDDAGKKLAMGAVITYVMSILVPAGYDLLDSIFK